MKLSLQLAQSTTDTDITSIGAQTIVAKIGAQLGAVEDVLEWGAKYQGVIVVQVVECEKHTNADTLSVCLIDDGGAVSDVPRDDKGYVQVVCGAPNVRIGLTVAWLPPGSIVPATATDQEPFVLGTRQLRGVVSHGMLASPSELGISDNHDGILEIDSSVAAGTPFMNLYQLDDTIIDLENKMFTHRPDCFGIIGVARELAGIQHKRYTSPDWYIREPQFAHNEDKPLEIQVDTNLVSRFSAIVVDAITIKPSPIWMQADLTKLGIRPINNIVDITNWLMYMTGQPLHAYDYDKVISVANKSNAILRARQSKKGDSLKLLNGKTVELSDATTIVICADDTPIGIGGVMGGADTEVDANTRTIVIEAASFDMYSIRKTSMKYGLFTDAVTRFNKGQSPLQTTRVLAKALELTKELAGGQQASSMSDYMDDTVKLMPAVVTDVDFINARLGSRLTADAMATLLQNVECPTDVEGNTITVHVPFWRRDLHIPEDIVEEVGRLHGFNALPIALPPRSSSPTERNGLVDFKYEIRNILSGSGANEVLGYSFVHKKVLDAANQNSDDAFQISNAISPHLQYYRLSLIPSLLENVHKNIKEGYGAFALYEIGKVHSKKWIDDDGMPIEAERVAFVFAADAKAQKNYQGEPYYQARVFLDTLATQVGITLEYRLWDSVDTSYTNGSLFRPFLPMRSAAIAIPDGAIVGIIGEFSTSEATVNKLPKYCAGFELDVNALYESVGRIKKDYTPLPKYPKVTQDITLAVNSDITYARLNSELKEAIQAVCPEYSYYEITPIDIYKADGKTVSYTFRLRVSNHARTLTAKDVNNLLDSATEIIAKSLGAIRK